MVELFSDEQRRRCPVCGARVSRASALACASWCDAAKECLGTKRYEELLASGAIEERPKDDESS
ncbi:MAG: hypothetical protein IBX63_08340 [Coriobacteriia bacterium]|nr:hypothetical protein [Coriobacteriia bacterium]